MREPVNTRLFTTPLISQHQKLDARIIDFGGWALPIHYGSQLEEHHAVRKDCGMFDVSHMTVSDITGKDTRPFLSRLLANDINKISRQPGKALYSCMLNESGGVIDDLIVYYINDEYYRMVTNAGTHAKVLAWLHKQAAPFHIAVTEKPELALLAIQGPNTMAKCRQVLEPDMAKSVTSLKRFQGAFLGDHLGEHFVARTGYTGEDGIELITNAAHANRLWDMFLAAQVRPCGLGARDTLRLESGMSLYGNDLSEDYTPFESGLKWTVDLQEERYFIGREALSESTTFSMIGLILQDRGILREHQKVVFNGADIGEITSGTFSPTLERSIAIARINRKLNLEWDNLTLNIGDLVQVCVRNKWLNAAVAHCPFVKNGLATNEST